MNDRLEGILFLATLLLFCLLLTALLEPHALTWGEMFIIFVIEGAVLAFAAWLAKKQRAR